MKNLQDVENWLDAITKHKIDAPQGAKTSPEGGFYELREVDPEAIKQFKELYKLDVDTTDFYRRTEFYDSEYITTLKFRYPFPRVLTGNESFREMLFNHPKALNQEYYRLVSRK